ncbi:uncharacterized protein LOC131941378 [Physella acuta]|uniref:uncharacterized protein LOC131941378 n=1 Tax=Physella acuta TaxID=109671 RepID=UPI0027DDBF17|nr:uncharacterized protein LOC131941378 [Physella acuta]
MKNPLPVAAIGIVLLQLTWTGFVRGMNPACGSNRYTGEKWFDGCRWCVCYPNGPVCSTEKCSSLVALLPPCSVLGSRWRDGSYYCTCSKSGITCEPNKDLVHHLWHEVPGWEDQSQSTCTSINDRRCVCDIDGVQLCSAEARDENANRKTKIKIRPGHHDPSLAKPYNQAKRIHKRDVDWLVKSGRHDYLPTNQIDVEVSPPNSFVKTHKNKGKGRQHHNKGEGRHHKNKGEGRPHKNKGEGRSHKNKGDGLRELDSYRHNSQSLDNLLGELVGAITGNSRQKHGEYHDSRQFYDSRQFDDSSLLDDSSQLDVSRLLEEDSFADYRYEQTPIHPDKLEDNQLVKNHKPKGKDRPHHRTTDESNTLNDLFGDDLYQPSHYFNDNRLPQDHGENSEGTRHQGLYGDNPFQPMPRLQNNVPANQRETYLNSARHFKKTHKHKVNYLGHKFDSFREDSQQLNNELGQIVRALFTGDRNIKHDGRKGTKDQQRDEPHIDPNKRSDEDMIPHHVFDPSMLKQWLTNGVQGDQPFQPTRVEHPKPVRVSHNRCKLADRWYTGSLRCRCLDAGSTVTCGEPSSVNAINDSFIRLVNWECRKGSKFELLDYCLVCLCQFSGFPLCSRSGEGSCSATPPIQHLWNFVDENVDSTGEFVDRPDSFIKREINTSSKTKQGATNSKSNSSSQSSENAEKRSGVTETHDTTRSPGSLTTSARLPRRLNFRPRYTVRPTVRVNTTSSNRSSTITRHVVTTTAPVPTTTPSVRSTPRTTTFQYMIPYTVVWGHRTGPIVYRPPPGVADCGDHAVGEIYAEGCNSCQCTNAGPRCTAKNCPSSGESPPVIG